MKKYMLIGLGMLQISMLSADDGFYTRAMSQATDGTWDWQDGWVYPETIGFQTHPVSWPESAQKKKLRAARAEQLSPAEQPKNQKARPRLSQWVNKQMAQHQQKKEQSAQKKASKKCAS